MPFIRRADDVDDDEMVAVFVFRAFVLVITMLAFFTTRIERKIC